jgi:hypothetical protein
MRGPDEVEHAMNTARTRFSDPALAKLPALLPDLEAFYQDMHAHPELSMQETRTSSLAADRLRAAGYEVTAKIGKTGVVGLLRNGEGPTVMLRGDMDALPVEEATGVPYASKATATDREGKTVPVMHACGHDMHVAWLAGAAALLAQARESWRGTMMAVFQPAEETAEGAQAMIDDGLFDRFPKPDIVLGQHVMVGPAGAIGGRAGVVTSAGDSLQIRLFGRGAHGSMPQASIDPVVMAAATVMRLQGSVTRTHGSSRVRRIPCSDAADFVCAAPVSTGRDPAGRLALSPIHVELPGCRGPARRSRARGYLRDDPSLGAQVRPGDRAAASAPTTGAEPAVAPRRDGCAHWGRADVPVARRRRRRRGSGYSRAAWARQGRRQKADAQAAQEARCRPDADHDG